jgi:hypothetical protein
MCIVLITPTGGRPIQFKFCQQFMKNQTYAGEVIWIIVDDCFPVTTNIVNEDFRENWTIVKVYPKPPWKQGLNTQGRNIAAGINAMPKFRDIKAIFIIEDDDYYKPIYLERMMLRFPGFQAIGEKNTVYYNVFFGGYVVNDNTRHASLFQTAFPLSSLPIFQQCLKEKFIDFVFFSMLSNINLFNEGNLAIGIKGMPGRYGIGAGHSPAMFNRTDRKDPNFNYLRTQIGEEDAKLYYGYNRDRRNIEHASFNKGRLR